MEEQKRSPKRPANQGRIENLIQAIQAVMDRPNMDLKSLQKIKSDYGRLTREDKPVFFRRLVELDIQPRDLIPVLEDMQALSRDPGRWPGFLTELRARIESPRTRLFGHFIRLAGGLKFLLELRADVLSAQRQGSEDISALDFDLVSLFESWFLAGFLFLEEITLDSPYRQIEHIMNGDLVHPMTRFEEMQRRLGRDRRCFALYHRAMPEEPVIFIEVALTPGMVTSIHEIIDEKERERSKKDTAVFYSINNTQNGLSGLGLGSLLIFQVVDFLRQVAPEIKNFCTLSPMPGFWRRYLRPILDGEDAKFKMKLERLEKLFDRKTRSLLAEEHVGQGGGDRDAFPKILGSVFSNARWTENEALVFNLAKPLERLGYIYLAEEKTQAGRPLDPVANFHLSNGASAGPGNVHFGANWSEKGIERSLSLMVNYIYSQQWRIQILESVSRLGGLIPGLSRPRGGRRPLERIPPDQS